MKKTRLLEIIREEIDTAINEIPAIAKDSKLEIEKPSKSKHLSEKYQIDEEIINEMASIIQTKKALKGLDDEKGLELVKDSEKETLEKLKKDPTITNDGRLRGFASNFKKNFKEKAGMDFLDFTIGIEEKWKKEKPGEDVPFKAPGLAINTAEKNAAKKLPGVTPSEEKPKSDSKKEKEEDKKEKKEPKAKSEPKSEPKSKTKSKSEPKAKARKKSEDEEKAEETADTDSTAKDLAKQTDVELAKQKKKEAVKDFTDKMKEVGVVGDDNKILDAKKYKEEFAKVKAKF
jgi:hypothetical protein